MTQSNKDKYMKHKNLALVAVFGVCALCTQPMSYATDCMKCESVAAQITGATTAESYDPSRPMCISVYDSVGCSYDLEGEPQRTVVTYKQLIDGQLVTVGQGIAYFYYCSTFDNPGCSLPQ